MPSPSNEQACRDAIQKHGYCAQGGIATPAALNADCRQASSPRSTAPAGNAGGLAAGDFI